MKLLIVGDVHISETPPGRRDEHYCEDIFAKLEQVRALEQSRDVGATVFIGDIFHHKQANRVTHRLVQRLATLLESFAQPVYIVPGNHDLADGSLESLSRQPLGVLGMLPGVQVLTVPTSLPDGRVIAGVPGTGPVCDAKTDDETLSWFRPKVDVLFAHAPICQGTKPWATYAPEDLPVDAPWLVYGHQHDQAGDRGSVTLSDGSITRLVATGAISRGSISEAAEEPAVILLDTDALNEAAVIPLAHRPASEIFRWVEREAELADSERIEEFISQLGKATFSGFSREGLIQTIRERSDVEERVKSVAIEILETV